MEHLKTEARSFGQTLLLLGKWLLLALLMGLVVGLVGVAFAKCMAAATGFRTQHPWIIYALPVGGLAVVGVYHLLRNQKDGGTNQVLTALHTDGNLPFNMFPSIFIGTVLTHLVGGSAGREGAALQIGGSIGSQLGRCFRLSAADRKMMIVCGMSAAFAALFGTPMAAAVFALEVAAVGAMNYAALLPSVFAGFVASQMALLCGIAPERFFIHQLPNVAPAGVGRLLVLAVLCALLARVFCWLLHTAGHTYGKVKNPYLRAALGGALVLALTLLLGTQDYLGAGMPLIEQAMEGEVAPAAFLLKMIFTALTLGAGFKGGEIVPSLFVGATFGALFANLLGLSPAVCAALGMVSLFCGVTNCPLASLVLSFELFGLTDMPYFFVAIAVSYLASGYCSLYHTQKFTFAKEQPFALPQNDENQKEK